MTIPALAHSDNTQRASPAGHMLRTPTPGGVSTRQQATGGQVICNEGKQWPHSTKCPPNTMAQRCTQAMPLHVSAAHLRTGLSTRIHERTGLLWLARHQLALPGLTLRQPPAWTPSPPPWQTPSCCPHSLPRWCLGLLLLTLHILAHSLGDNYTALEHLCQYWGLT